MDFQLHTFKNGIRLFYKQTGMPGISHCGLFIDAGTRDEPIGKGGLAHFIEHMLFKGTNKRRSVHILNRLEIVGGELNAYTSREKTCVYAAISDPYFDRALELLADITFNSSFPENEIEKEKKVIMEEISMYADNPEETIYDEFQEHLFFHHPLGLPILGSNESVENISRADILKFIAENYSTNDIVFSYVGNLPYKTVLKRAERNLENIPEKIKIGKRLKFNGYEKFNIEKSTENIQTYGIIGNLGFDVHSPKKTGLTLLTNLLGGPGLNSRLNMSIREKYGYTYNIEAGFNPYTDSGIFSVFFGTDKKFLNKTTDLVLKEFKKLREVKLTPIQLKNAKKQFEGQLLLAEENKSSLMLGFGNMLLETGKIETISDLIKKVDNVTSDDLIEIANEVLNPDKLSFLFFKGS